MAALEYEVRDEYRDYTIAQLLDAGAAWKVTNADELSARVCSLLGDANLRHSTGERGRNIVLKNRGNVEKIMELIKDSFRAHVT